MFKNTIKYPKYLYVCISYKIESVIYIANLKYGNKQDMTNIFDILINNNAFLTHDKFQSHKEQFTGFIINISPRITLRCRIDENLQDTLI